MATVAVTIAITIVVTVVLRFFLNYLKLLKFVWNYPTPSVPIPLFGHTHKFFKVERQDLLETLLKLTKADPKYRKVCILAGQSPQDDPKGY